MSQALSLNWRQRLALVILPTLLLLLVGELAARVRYALHHQSLGYLIAPLGGKQMQVVYPLNPRKTYTQYDPETDREITFTINAQGGRGKEWNLQKPRGGIRLAGMGGSSTFGVNNPDDQTWPALLEQALKPKTSKPVEVFNAGLPGYALKDFNEFIVRPLADYSVDQILYYEGWNDTDLPLASQVHHNVRRFHEQGPLGWLSGLLYRRSMLYTFLLEKTQFALVSRRSGWVPDVQRFEQQLNELIQRSRKAKAVPVIVLQVLEASHQPAVAQLRARLKSTNLHDKAVVEALMREFVPKIKIREDDALTILRVAQTQVLLEAAQRIANKESVRVLDPLPAFLNRPTQELFCDIVHLTDEGNRVLAESIALELGSDL